MAEISCQDFLDAVEKKLTPDKFQEIQGELWLRWPYVSYRLLRGGLLDRVVADEIRRACTLLMNPANRVRARPNNRTFTNHNIDDKTQHIRRKW